MKNKRAKAVALVILTVCTAGGAWMQITQNPVLTFTTAWNCALFDAIFGYVLCLALEGDWDSKKDERYRYYVE